MSLIFAYSAYSAMVCSVTNMLDVLVKEILREFFCYCFALSKIFGCTFRNMIKMQNIDVFTLWIMIVYALLCRLIINFFALRSFM